MKPKECAASGSFLPTLFSFFVPFVEEKQHRKNNRFLHYNHFFFPLISKVPSSKNSSCSSSTQWFDSRNSSIYIRFIIDMICSVQSKTCKGTKNQIKCSTFFMKFKTLCKSLLLQISSKQWLVDSFIFSGGRLFMEKWQDKKRRLQCWPLLHPHIFNSSGSQSMVLVMCLSFPKSDVTSCDSNITQ